MSEACIAEVHRIDCLPTELCLQFGKFSPEKFIAKMFRYGETVPTAKLPISLENDCEVCITIPEKVARCGAGRFYIEILDGCTPCDQIEIELVAECKIESITKTSALPKPERCNDCR